MKHKIYLNYKEFVKDHLKDKNLIVERKFNLCTKESVSDLFLVLAIIFLGFTIASIIPAVVFIENEFLAFLVIFGIGFIMILLSVIGVRLRPDFEYIAKKYCAEEYKEAEERTQEALLLESEYKESLVEKRRAKAERIIENKDFQAVYDLLLDIEFYKKDCR